MRVLAVIALLSGGGTAAAAPATTACTDGLCYTDEGGPIGYVHAILGDTPEGRKVTFAGRSFAFEAGFIEDTAPRMADVNGDGAPEAIVVHSVAGLGARLVVLALPDLQIIAATPHIGMHHRWMGFAGTGDFDGDGRIEIAYVDRPHLAQQLVFLRLQGGQLIEVDRQFGLTNHRIGDAYIQSTPRPCAGDILLMSPDWSRMMAAKIGAQPVDLGRFTPQAWARAVECAAP